MPSSFILTLTTEDAPTTDEKSCIPTNENTKTSPALAFMAYLPSKSLWTLLFVPLITILTPGIDPMASETTPVTVRSCAKAN